MTLKKYEVDAIVSTIMDKLRSNITVPNLSSIVDEKEKAHLKCEEIREKIKKLNFQISELTNKHKINGYGTFNRDFVKKNEINSFINSNLPNQSDIERAVILSNNKDLNDIVKEILEMYSEK